MNSAERHAPAEQADDSGVSPKEKALWLLESLVPGTPVNNLSVAFSVTGRLDPARLDTALAEVVRRHEALRTVYRGDGTRLAGRVVPAEEFALRVDLFELPARPTDDDLAPVTAAPFALDGGPLLRAALFRAPDTDVFCATAHHLVFDGVSGTVLLEELADAYERADGVPGEAPAAPPGWRQAPPSPESLAFWREELAGARTDVLELSCAASEPERPTLAAARVERTLAPAAADAVRRLSDELGVPASAVLLAAYYALLEAHGAGPDLLVGAPVDIRPGHAARSIGYHVSYVPLRVRVDREESVRDLVRRSAGKLLAGRAHADVAVDAHAELVPAAPSGRRSLPFRHVFDHRDAPGPEGLTLGGLKAEPYPADSGSGKFDLHLTAVPADDGVRLSALYRSELFARADAELLLARFEAVLTSFAEDPGRPVGEVRRWSDRDREVIGAANDTNRPVEPATVLAAIRDRVREAPDAVAFADGDREVSYRLLWAAAHAVRDLLRDAGPTVGDVVAVALPRGPELAAAVLGAWLAGAAYLPVDSAHPEERIRYQLSDSAAKVLLATEDMARFAGDGVTVLTPAPVEAARDREVPAAPAPGEDPDPSSCAYLIYTSGSTGRPKGTLLPHAALANVTAHFAEELGATAADTTLWTTTFAFDISGLELFVPLVTGGRLVAAPDRAKSDGRVMRELVERYGARFVQATPTTWRLIIDRMEGCLRGLSVLAGGEPVPVPLAQRFTAAGCVFHHVYGPTETAIWSTSRVVTERPEGRLDVGRPIRNTQLLILDEHGRDLPVGVRGELCIAGSGVAIGYHGRPELNAERFGEHPGYGRFYRTGDVARWREDGAVDLFGRSDRQVKLRGNRIELGEIESTLLSHPEVGAAAVIMIGDPSSDAVLIGCLEPAGGALDTGSVWAHARARLSKSMLPADLITVDAMPINGSGKVDYPALERTFADRREHLAAQRAGEWDGADLGDELTARLTALFGTLLRREDVTADTDFFDNGGNSMLAAVAMQELQNMSGVSLSLTEVFERRTPRGLAARVRDTAGREAPAG